MKRLLLLVLAVFAFAAFAATASADPPLFHSVKEPYAGSLTLPAGSFCDFNYQLDVTGTATYSVLANGLIQDSEHFQATLTNVDTGVSLYESDSYHNTFNYLDGSYKSVGIQGKFRDANGKIVDVYAGELVFDSNYNIVKFTPNAGADYAESTKVICNALGGNPA